MIWLDLTSRLKSSKINGEIFNVGYKNQTVNELADNVKEVIGEDVKIIKPVQMIIDLTMLVVKK